MEPNKNSDNKGRICYQASCSWSLPAWFTEDLKRLLKLAWPIVLASAMQYMTTVISMIFCGRLGTTVLAGVALAIMMINISVVSVGQGLTTACDTLFSQSFGSTNKKMVGIYLQRSLIILFLASVVISAFLLNVETILLVTGQTAVTSRIASEYAMLFIPGTLANFQYQVLSRYLMNQNQVKPLIIISTVSNGLNALVHYLLMFQADLGYHGSSLALSCCHISLLILTIGYICWSKVYEITWPGWRVDALYDWAGFMKLGIPGLIMVFFDFLIAEIGTILAGLLGEVELATMTIATQIATITYQVFYGIAVATGVLVGQNLGFGDSKGAKNAAKVGMVAAVSVGAVLAAFYFSTREYIPMAFSNDPKVISLSATLLLIPGAYQIIAAINQTNSGIFRGAGRQRRGAACIVISYCVALPMSVCLMMLTDLGVIGFYIGLLGAIVFGATSQSVLLSRLKWDEEVERAALVARVRIDETDEKPTEKSLLLPKATEYGTIPNQKIESKKEGGTKLFLKRLAVIGVVLAILGGGILASLFIKVDTGDDYELRNSTATPDVSLPVGLSTTELPFPKNHTMERLFGLFR